MPRTKNYKVSKATKTYVKKALAAETELKAFATAETAISIGSTGTSRINLVQIAQGDGFLNRDGNQIKVKKITLNWRLNHSSSASIPTHARLLIVRNKDQVADYQPVWDDVMNSASALATRHPVTGNRYAHVYDKDIIADTYHPLVRGSVTLKMNTDVRFNGTIGDDVEKNGYTLLYISNQVLYTPTFTYTWQTHFTDA